MIRDTSRSFAAVVLVLSAGLAVLLAPTQEALAAAALYHSPAGDGTPPPAPPTLGSSSESLSLYVDIIGTDTTQTGVACVDGDGGEVCAWEATIRAEVGAALLAFTPAPGVVYQLDAAELRANGLSVVSPDASPVSIGQLMVESTNPATGGEIVVVGSRAVDAGLQYDDVPDGVIAIIPVPEPKTALMLVAGVAGLAVISRRRAARSAPSK